jgi:3-hydroxymyristoyl/3-hydroxydecanoyl-(acyl carrier protein) dehydratase
VDDAQMNETWFTLAEIRELDGGLDATASVAESSPFFAGHFPGRPVVPGVAMLAIVEALVEERARIEGAPRAIVALSRVRFRTIVESACAFRSRLRARASGEGEGFEFELGLGDLKVCDGRVITSAGGARRTEPAASEVARPRAEHGGIDLDELVPHRGRMRLVGGIVEVSEGRCITRSRIDGSWPLCDGASSSPVVLVELVAQTASALMGWERREIERMGGRGFLVGVRRATFAGGRIPVGADLIATVTTVLRRDNYATFEGRVESGGAMVASVEIQAIRP